MFWSEVGWENCKWNDIFFIHPEVDEVSSPLTVDSNGFLSKITSLHVIHEKLTPDSLLQCKWSLLMPRENKWIMKLWAR